MARESILYKLIKMLFSEVGNKLLLLNGLVFMEMLLWKTFINGYAQNKIVWILLFCMPSQLSPASLSLGRPQLRLRRKMQHVCGPKCNAHILKMFVHTYLRAFVGAGRQLLGRNII